MEKPAKAVNIRHRKHISTFPVWVVFLCMLPGILHYTPPLRKRKSEGIKKGYLSQTANLLLTLNLIL